MADQDIANSSISTVSGALHTPTEGHPPADAGSHQPEWTSQQLMAMIQNGQTLSSEDRQRLETHLQELEAQQTLAQKLASFEKSNVAKNTKKRTRPSHRHNMTPNSSESSDSDTVPPKHHPRGPKVTHVQTLEHTASLRKWGDWKHDVQRVFDADPFIYRKQPWNKVLKALDYVDEYLKSLWTTHLTQHPDDEKDWDVFLQWTKRNIAQGLNSETTLYKQYQDAKQRPNQPPREFNNYLTSLERDLEHKTEKETAMAFYVRLDDDLRRQFDISNINLATTRSQMVDIAQRVWEGLKDRTPENAEERGRHHKKQKSSKDKPQPPPREKAKREGLCFRCGRKGHYMDDCPESAETIVQAVISSRYPQSRSPSPTWPNRYTYMSDSDHSFY